MNNTSRRRFLKGMGAALASVGVVSGTAALTQDAPPTAAQPGSPARHSLTAQALAVLVVEQLSAWVSAGRAFTAYDLTRELRIIRPGVDIRHSEVRPIVHQRMSVLVDRQFYAQQIVAFRDGDAIRYVVL